MRLVDNWDDVVPPEQEETEEEGDEESALQSFEDTLAERTEENRVPTAVPDEFGIRPGRTTILSVLDNDSDPDGDVLVISEYGAIAESTGTLALIDGDRACSSPPRPATTAGSVRFSYTVDDGRGGTASAEVMARVVPDGQNSQPVELRRSAVTVEANQTVEYNVLANWRDPDGDDMFLIGAAPTSGDLVRFTPDGIVTFTHQTSELGEKEVQFQVTDGNGDAAIGTLTVKVEPAGSQKPVGTPDFATAFTDEQLVLKPLTNDISPSGAPLCDHRHPGSGQWRRRHARHREERGALQLVDSWRLLLRVQPGGGITAERRHRASRRPSGSWQTRRCSPIAVKDTGVSARRPGPRPSRCSPTT